ncbi:energy-coupling factor transporter ATP-binding protein EcfA2 [Allocatelliglobosispora scoriae]|uniref:Nuclease SbcCD subunit C n=1 Tax=Allocatelliglobosispora scoriae TaxID=643052 RepID=A0A841BW52_9ACTN|nr:AAA family ATPase [Allocatelliglobosispora scoriae]MBB5871905.1 energy-coupling factor transporter ATP-binding protein EcfA2 [Allocatelliglobosispora scoriae]
MKFTSLTMRNWRPFHGTHRIDFSTDPDKPVTLVLGPNGAGKTALLNAFTWALYGQFTDGFEGPESLVNFEALKGDATAEAFVELELEHEENKFRVRRATDARRQSNGDYDLTVTKNGERAVEDDIYRILPKPLKDLFFFPAETFSTASVLQGDRPGEGASLDIGSAIRSLLAGDIYDHAVEDLRGAIASDALRPTQKYTDDTVEAARRAWEQAQAELNAAEERRDKLPSLLAQARDQAGKAKKEAEKYNPEEIKKWELEYNDLKDRVTGAEKAVQQANDLYVELARKAYLHFGHHASESAVRRLDIAEKAGLMPPRIHDSVLHQSLADGRCALCQVDFSDQARDRVEKLLEHVTEHAMAVLGLETRTQLRSHLEKTEREIAELRGQVGALALDLTVPGPPQDADMKMLQSVLRMCIDVADRMVVKARREFKEFTDAQDIPMPAQGNSPVDIAMLKQQFVDRLEQESRDIAANILKATEGERDKLADYTRKSSKSDGYKRKTAAIEILREVKDFFDAARKGLNHFGREDFQKAINDTYSDLIAKPFEIRVGEDFGISVGAPGRDEAMPLSQSEKVLLLIAFLGAIARLAPQYAEIARRNEQFQRTGDVATSKKVGFPVVLDSPTSPLDNEYEADVIKALPQLLPQIVIIVSAKSVEAWEEISEHIGSANIMELTSHKTSNRVVKWKGKDHIYSTQDDGVDPARTRMTLIG